METIINFRTIIKIVVFIITCIIAMQLGYEYGEYRTEYTTSVVSREWSYSDGGYRVREVTRDGFGDIVDYDYYIEN